jgi:hypothetical protein
MVEKTKRVVMVTQRTSNAEPKTSVFETNRNE